MGGGLESRCVVRVYGADGACDSRHHPHRIRCNGTVLTKGRPSIIEVIVLHYKLESRALLR